MSMSKFFAGVIVGVTAGLLLAPEKGSDTREHLADAADKWKHKLDKMIGKADTELADLKDYLEKDIEGLGEEFKSRILDIIADAEKKAAKIKTQTT